MSSRTNIARLLVVGGALFLGGCFVHCGKVNMPPPAGNMPDEFQRSSEQRDREMRAFDDSWRQSAQGQSRGGATNATPPALPAAIAGGLAVGGGVAAVVGSSDRDASTTAPPADESVH